MKKDPFKQGTHHVTYLHIDSDDHRRDKRRCLFFCDDKCSKKAGLCYGSAHCKNYVEGGVAEDKKASFFNNILNKREITIDDRGLLDNYINELKANANPKESNRLLLHNEVFRRFKELNNPSTLGFYPERSVAEKALKAVIKAYNAELLFEKLDELEEGNDKDKSIIYYFSNSDVMGALSLDYDHYRYSVRSKTDTISPFDALRVIKPMSLDTIITLCCIYADNLVKSEYNNDSIHISSRAHTDEYDRLKRKMGWNKTSQQLSKSELAKQFTDLANYVIPSYDIIMLSINVRACRNQFVNSSKGAINRKHDRTIVNILMNEIRRQYLFLANKKACPD
ncbi:MAG: hypothetical protein E7423_07215 [Ruminococcaceae bacterium]|nr:hypothetical protein [Oscillospiraceae bacterium]